MINIGGGNCVNAAHVVAVGDVPDKLPKGTINLAYDKEPKSIIITTSKPILSFVGAKTIQNRIVQETADEEEDEEEETG